MNKFYCLGLLLAASPTFDARAQDAAACPSLPAGSNLHWEAKAGNGFTVCRALDGERQVLGLMLTSQPTVNLLRRNREEQGTIGAHEVRWYQPEVAVQGSERRRITIVELGDDRYAQVWVDASNDYELQQLLSLAQGIALN
ncbi:hypothetical protein MNQ95_01425 [Pseudoxanthomonas daejeonensis]|uniref:Uncharacterized protein n=1 Tax=Pseudoxanthomonas daejeonensis TaxID=266062 RepID=A0ABQ6Z386_9GAMM|nr:hypothetical protein [Pseudoxanthomonas daejeonensis]KAF1691910.1 hypothetical protein CSC65_15330 [Pseudoxanthomonas daejeonensis]UNK57804.1 hypothetical protein MNQ95_01425 [Pseudoxanthomonas daejeonensis]